jgi:hypothetical protein
MVTMSGHDTRAERIRALLDEVDRICSESEQVMHQVDRAMKHPFWPDRRRSSRIPVERERRSVDDGGDHKDPA